MEDELEPFERNSQQRGKEELPVTHNEPEEEKSLTTEDTGTSHDMNPK